MVGSSSHMASSSTRTPRAGNRRSGRPARVVTRANLSMHSKPVPRTAVESIKDLSLITAVKTPYLLNGRFDLDAYDALIQAQVDGGVGGVIVGGTTGEGHLMSWDEHVMLIAHTVNAFGDKLKVIGNTGSNSTREAIHASEQGFAVGMHAALHINPYYGKTSEAGMVAHFKASLDEGPAIVYNVPGRTGQDIPNAVIEEVSQHPNFIGVKECTGNARIAAYEAQGIACWSGNDDECHEGRHSSGSHGVISVTSNVIPGLFASLMANEDAALNAKLQGLVNWLFLQPNPIGVNTMLCMLGVSNPVFRMPYVPYDRKLREEGEALIRAIGPEHFVGDASMLRVLEDSDFTVVDAF